ncbi:MAG: transcriptional regulator [Candidatus Margulisiibacteriota bacterium]
MNDDQLLKHYIQLAEVVAEMFKPLVETVVVDYRHKKTKIIAIFNNSITERKVGDDTTNVGHLRLQNKIPDRMIGYPNTSPKGNRLKSTALAIRNQKGDLIGGMGMHLDVSHFDQFMVVMQQFVSTDKPVELQERENFHYTDAAQEISMTIKAVLSEMNWQVHRLRPKDKKKLLEILKQRGVFKQRSAVSTIAQELGITRQSVYQYLKQMTA